MSTQIERLSVVPSFESIEALKIGLAAKDAFKPADLYPRDGTVELNQLEARFADLAGVEADELVLATSGMAAVVGAVEACLGSDSVLAYAAQGYSQTLRYIEQIKRRGPKTVWFDAGETDTVERAIHKHRPDVILSETVGNGPDVAVLDVAALLEATAHYNPYIILDNTLPLSTSCPLGDVLTADRKVVGVESGTKSYAFNAELCGLIYTKHPDLLHRIREQRRTTGFTPNVATVKYLDKLLPQTKDQFHDRNRAIFETTKQLGAACLAVEKPDIFVVSHPAKLGIHAVGTPVFFLQCTGPLDQFELAGQFWDHPAVRQHCALGQSFGFDETRILPDAHYPAVRIAGGANVDRPALAAAFQKQLETLRT